MADRAKRFSKTERSWIFYDWANSVYATNIMAAIFPIYFTAVCNSAFGGADVGMQYWGYGTSAATLIVALSAPILGAVGDYKGMKKKLFSFFLLLGVVFTLVMAIFDQWQMLLVGYVISYIGFAGSNLFYDSFLTDVTTEDRMDKVSTWGYAMGYIGGSTIPFVISIVVLLMMGMDNPVAVKISVVLTSVWWAAFSIPMLKNVRQTYYTETPPNRLIRSTFQNIGRTVQAIYRNKTIFLFILAYFCYIDGVGTVIHMSTSYGSTLGLDTTGMIIALLVTQLVAVPCSILFGRLAKKAGAVRMIGIAIVVYFLICVVGFYMGFHIEQTSRALYDQALGQNAISSTVTLEQYTQTLLDSGNAVYASAVSLSQVLFWMMAFLVGTVQGGIQALSRSFFGRLIPPEKSNEYFGFYDIFGKFATVVGPLLVALFSGVTGRSSIGILSLMLLFALGGLLLFLGRKRFRQVNT